MFRFILVADDGDVSGTDDERIAKAAVEDGTFVVLDLDYPGGSPAQRFGTIGRNGSVLWDAFDAADPEDWDLEED